MSFTQMVTCSNTTLCSPVMAKVASLLVTGVAGSKGLVAVHVICPVSDLRTDRIARELEICGGSVCPRIEVCMLILDDVMMTAPFSVHVMAGVGRLPEWRQKKMTNELSSTVWLSGSVMKESRITVCDQKILVYNNIKTISSN